MSQQFVLTRSYMIRFFMPILVTLTLVIFLSLLTLDYYHLINQPPETITPVSPNEEGTNQAEVGIANMLIYVVMIALGSSIVLLIVKKGKYNLLLLGFSLLTAFASFSLTLFFFPLMLIELFLYLPLDAIVVLIPEYWFTILILGVSFAMAILAFYAMNPTLNRSIFLRNSMLILFGAGIGTIFGIHFPVISAVLVLIALSLYDIYSVFKGPIRGILEHFISSSSTQVTSTNTDVRTPMEEVTTETTKQTFIGMPLLPIYSSGDVNIGLGDFAFYSMLIAHSLKISDLAGSPLPFIFTLIGLLLGIGMTLYLLQKRPTLPGLPISIFLGLVGLFLGLLVGAPNIETLNHVLRS